MKKAITVFTLLAGTLGAYAQGTLVFGDYGNGFTIDVFSPQLAHPTTQQFGNSSFDNPTGSSVYSGVGLGGAAGGAITPNNYANGALWTLALYAAPGVNNTSGLNAAEAAGAPILTSLFQTSGGTGSANTGILGNDSAGVWALDVNSNVRITLNGFTGGATLQLQVWYNGDVTNPANFGAQYAASPVSGASIIGSIAALGGTGSPPAVTPTFDASRITSFSLIETQPMSSNSLWAMGYNGTGAIGAGTLSQTNLPDLIVYGNIMAVAAGGQHSLFLMTNGSLWAMGDGLFGDLGDGTNTASAVPMMIVPSNVTAIAAGQFHDLFLKSDGSLWGMGTNGQGQLGGGTTNSQSFVPVMIVSNNVTAIAAGNSHSLFLMTNGSLWVMGNNFYGQLGDGGNLNTNRPEMIESGGVMAIAAGEEHSLFLKTNGSLWAMGYNEDGQLGDGTTVNTNRPEMITTSTNVTAIAAGFDHSMFLESDGSLWTMGDNSYGQLGDGTTNSQSVPEKIVSANVTNIAAGWYHSLFLTTNGSLWGMGADYYGQLGDGKANTTNTHFGTNLPEQIVASNVTAIAAGEYHTLFIAPASLATETNDVISLSASPSDGGTVSVEGVSGGSFPEGSVQTITATANSGFEFIGWTGDATGTENPLQVTVTGNLSITANFAVITNLTLTVITNGYGTITPDPNGKLFKTNSIHTLIATAKLGNVFSNWTGSITTNKNPLTFKLVSSMVLQANFITNPFLPVKGTYNGLFFTTNGVTEQTAGMLRGLIIGTRGNYSGTLLINGAGHALGGLFDLAGQATNKIPRPLAQGGPLTLVMTVNTNNPPPQVTGTVFGTNDGNPWVASLIADLATNALLSAEYTLLLPPDTNNAPPTNSPGGDGYALITNHSGTARITGALADGAVFNQTVPVSLDGYVPIFANLYANKGLLLGWINLDSINTNDVSLTWIHPTRTSGLYMNGFTNVLLTNQILLSPWTNPPADIDLLTNLSILETTGGGNPPISVTTTTAGRVSGTSVSGAINLKTGLLTVTIGSGPARTNAYGAILLNATNGGGYFLTKTNAQAIKLEP